MRPLFFALIIALIAMPLSADGPNVIHDVVYGHKDGLALSYDVITPAEDVEANGAMVVLVVSGGWFSAWFPAEKLLDPANDFGTFARMLLADGYTVAIVRHGSAPKYNAVDATKDIKRALKHLRSDIPTHGLDPERIGVFGFSAGGHLSLMLGSMGGKELPGWVKRQRLDREDDQKIERGAAPVAAVVAWYPPTDLRKIVGPSPSFPALDFDPDDAPGISPILLADKGDAPTLFLHGENDRLVPVRSSTAMHEALKGAGVETEIELFEGVGHGFRGEPQRRAERLAKAWFDAHLLP